MLFGNTKERIGQQETVLLIKPHEQQQLQDYYYMTDCVAKNVLSFTENPRLLLTLVSYILSHSWPDCLLAAESIGMVSTGADANNPDLFHRRNEGQPYGLRPAICKYNTKHKS